MRSKSFYSFVILLFVFNYKVYSQEADSLLVKGEIVNISLNPVPYVNVISLLTSKGTFSDDEGKFNIKVLRKDTILFSGISFRPKKMAVSQLNFENNYIILDSMVYSIPQIDIMDFRRKELERKMMDIKLTPMEQKILVIEGLPDPYTELIQIKPKLVSNPISAIYEFFKAENIRKRRQSRWNNTYDKTWIIIDKSKP